jgi:O-antigen ligase
MLKDSQKLHRLVLLLLLWQLASVYLMAVGAWPVWVAWVNMLLVVLFILVAPAFFGLLLVVASIPFFVVLPSRYSDTLSMWRPAVAVLFLKSLLAVISHTISRPGADDSASISLDARLHTARDHKAGVVGFGMRWLAGFMKKAWNILFSYEKFAIALLMLGALSLILAHYPARGASQLIFLLNTALVYPVVVWVVTSREYFIRLLKYGALSTGLIIAIGYVQFMATLFSVTYYFWQYWALRVASLYYGLPLAKVLQYSNSWVTVQGHEKILRMFSIMTSSHAFAMVCVLFLVFALPLLYLLPTRRVVKNEGAYVLRRSLWLWVAIVLACLALIISGTRGVWAGMVPALVLGGILYYRTFLKQYLVPILACMLLVVILFEASPLLDMGFSWVRKAGGESTLDRVASIVDVEETSNAGRILMWKAASRYALHHPFGVGYANFVVTLSLTGQDMSFDQAASQENKLYQLPQRYVTAHSLYLQLLVELSILGLALFGLFWLLLFKKMWLYVRSASVAPESVFIATAAVVFIWFLAYSVFDVTWLNDKILLYTFVVLGLVRAVLVLNSRPNKDE